VTWLSFFGSETEMTDTVRVYLRRWRKPNHVSNYATSNRFQASAHRSDLDFPDTEGPPEPERWSCEAASVCCGVVGRRM
jgi:hypothetical protein